MLDKEIGNVTSFGQNNWKIDTSGNLACLRHPLTRTIPLASGKGSSLHKELQPFMDLFFWERAALSFGSPGGASEVKVLISSLR